MRKDRILALAQFLENLPEVKFNMNHFFSIYDDEQECVRDTIGQDFFIKSANECGTAGCIAGWAIFVMSTEMETAQDGRIKNEIESILLSDTIWRTSSSKASKYLGISPAVGEKLFYADSGSFWDKYSEYLDIEGSGRFIDWDSIKPSDAAVILRMLANDEIEGVLNGKLLTEYPGYVWAEPDEESDNSVTTTEMES